MLLVVMMLEMLVMVVEGVEVDQNDMVHVKKMWQL